jgi:hypothetical protein
LVADEPVFLSLRVLSAPEGSRHGLDQRDVLLVTQRHPAGRLLPRSSTSLASKRSDKC